MTNLATITQALSIVAACWAIISGVGAWKREFIGKRKIELAEETLATFFAIKDAVGFIRHPVSSGNEGKTREKNDQETPDESRLLDRGYIVFERYEAKKDLFVKFNTLKYRFMASFGSETDSIFKDTNNVVNGIFSAASMLATYYWPRQGTGAMTEEEFKRHLSEMHSHQGIFWDHFSEKDTVRIELSRIQGELERIVKPCFSESRGWLIENWRKVSSKRDG